MTVPLFVRIQDYLINLSACEGMWIEEEVLTISYSGDTLDISFDSAQDAEVAFRNLQATLVTKNLFLGEVQ